MNSKTKGLDRRVFFQIAQKTQVVRKTAVFKSILF